MGTFADFRKTWDEAKKKAPDPALAKKTFSKGMGPVLTELDGACKDLATARGKSGWNPETIAVLSPKVIALSDKAKVIADEYEKAALKNKWKDLVQLAGKIGIALAARSDTETKEWRPTKDYILLWRRATLELALSAAGLADAQTAEDLRKLLADKTATVNKDRGTEKDMRDRIATLTRTWPTVDGVTSEVPWIAGKVAIVLKTPTLTGAADEARKRLVTIVARKQAFEPQLKELKTFAAKPEVQKGPVKSQADQAVKDGDAILKAYTETITKAAAVVAKLPKA
jgi:hypothetical protein